MDRQIYKQAGRHINRQTDIQIHAHTHTHTHSKHADRRIRRQAYKHAVRYTYERAGR